MENLEKMTPSERAEYWKEKTQANAEPKEKEKPIRSKKVWLGENANINFALWPTSLQITKGYKDRETGQWKNTSISLTKQQLVELFARIQGFIIELEAREPHEPK